MITYGEFRPSPFDTRGIGLSDRQDWLVAPVGQNRDSEALPRSNFFTAVKLFEEKDEEGDDFEVHRFGHWGPGWFELILVRPGSECAKVAEEIEAALADYPVLDDEYFSQLEWEEREQIETSEDYGDIQE